MHTRGASKCTYHAADSGVAARLAEFDAQLQVERSELQVQWQAASTQDATAKREQAARESKQRASAAQKKLEISILSAAVVASRLAPLCRCQSAPD